MSKPKVFEKPSGVKDYLPGAVERLRCIEERVLTCMKRWGYRRILTPTIEYYDTVGVMSATSDKKLFKLLDNRGKTLVLRSEMTAPIARVVASVLKDERLPIRLAYHANVFRAFEDESGRDAEFFQTGVELVGDASADADAEVIALAVASLKAAGLSEFKLALGHQGLLNGLLGELLDGMPAEQDQLRERLLARDYVGYRRLIRGFDVSPAVKEKLLGVLELQGGREVCEKVAGFTSQPSTQAAIGHLCEIWDALQSYGVSGYMTIDLTMIGNFSYYTGMIFEAYAAGLGFPVTSGGRYDNLLHSFGRPAPATGFALKTTRILEILGPVEEDSAKRVLILYVPERRAEALAEAAELRSTGEFTVVTRRIEAEEAPGAAAVMRQDGGPCDGMTADEVIVWTAEGRKGGAQG